MKSRASNPYFTGLMLLAAIAGALLVLGLPSLRELRNVQVSRAPEIPGPFETVPTIRLLPDAMNESPETFWDDYQWIHRWPGEMQGAGESLQEWLLRAGQLDGDQNTPGSRR